MPQAPVRPQRRRQASTPASRPDRRTWAGAVEAFLGDCRRRNLSPATIETYRWVLAGERLTTFRADHRITGPTRLTAELLKAFELELVDAGLRAGSVAVFHRTLRTFLGFCRAEGLGVGDGVLEVRGPRQPREEPETFTPAEEKRLIEGARTERDRILVEFMLRTGLRLSEVAAVTIDDVIDSPEGAYVRVRQGKGRKDRIVPLDTGASKFSRQLRRYIESSRPADSRERALFVTNRREGGEPVALTTYGIKVMLTRLGEAAGVHANPHKLRHTFATRALSAGVDVMALQRALGHTTLAMVSRYVHYQKDDLLEAWRRRRD